MGKIFPSSENLNSCWCCSSARSVFPRLPSPLLPTRCTLLTVQGREGERVRGSRITYFVGLSSELRERGSDFFCDGHLTSSSLAFRKINFVKVMVQPVGCIYFLSPHLPRLKLFRRKEEAERFNETVPFLSELSSL